MTALGVALALAIAAIVGLAYLASRAADRARVLEIERNTVRVQLAGAEKQLAVSIDNESLARRLLEVERRKRGERHEANAQANAPGGAAAVDAALDRLPKDGPR